MSGHGVADAGLGAVALRLVLDQQLGGRFALVRVDVGALQICGHRGTSRVG